MTNAETKITTNRQPYDLTVDYGAMQVNFKFGGGRYDSSFALPIKAYGTKPEMFESMSFGEVVSVAVAEDDIKTLCLGENHSLADFEAIRLSVKSFLRDH